MMIARLLFLTIFLISTSISAHALSCHGLRDQFFIECNDGICQVAFRAREIQTVGGCARRLFVEEPDTETKRLILNQIPDRAASRFIELTLNHRYYGNIPSNADELRLALNDGSYKAPKIVLKNLAANTNLIALRKEKETKQFESFLNWIAIWFIEITSFLLGLYVLYRSVSRFRRLLFGLDSGTLIKPISVQVMLFVVTILLLGFDWLMLLNLVAPLILLVWLYELGIYAYQRLKKSQ